MTELVVFAKAVGARRAIVRCAALLSVAIAWAPFACGNEHTVGQDAGEADLDVSVAASDPIGDANALIRAGDAQGAIDLLADYAPQAGTEKAIKRLTLAAAFTRAMDLESALAQYAAVAETPDGLPPNILAAALFGAGQLCLRFGRHEDAVNHLEAWKRHVVEPQATPHAALSRAYKELGQYALAIENLEVALRLAEDEVPHSELYAEAVKRWRTALADLRRLAAEQ